MGRLLVLCAALMSACAHPSHVAQPPVDTVVLPASVPDSALFCIEDPHMTWPMEQNIVRKATGLVCQWTVHDIRNWASKQRAADE